jgi:hypothetical protein
MLIIGAHRINHGGYDRGICQQILTSRELLGSGTFGRSGYAYYADQISMEYRNDPFVIFQPDQPARSQSSIEITHVHIVGITVGNHHVRDSCFFVVQNKSTGGHVPIIILGFVDCEPQFPQYYGRLSFVSGT